MKSETPLAPLVPADVDLSNFDFMPLEVKRLTDSEMASDADPASSWFAVLLWCKAWHQVPAGSIPNNDAWMARVVGLGRDVQTWLAHKNFALRGFVECSDGRLYHRIVCEKALQSWIAKLRAAVKSARGNRARWGADIQLDEAAMQAQLDLAEAALDALCELNGKPVKKKAAAEPKPEPPAPAPAPAAPPPAVAPVEPPPSDPPPKPVKPAKAPKATKRAALAEAKYSRGFEAWWDEFPNTRKTNKKGCWEKWQRDQLEDFADTLLKDVQDRKVRDWKWIKQGGEFVPMPITYLNQHRWNDPFTPAPTSGGRTAQTEDRNDATAEDWARDGT